MTDQPTTPEPTLEEQLANIDKDTVSCSDGMNICLSGFGRNIALQARDAIREAREGIEEEDQDDEDYQPPENRIAGQLEFLVDVAQQLNKAMQSLQIKLNRAEADLKAERKDKSETISYYARQVREYRARLGMDHAPDLNLPADEVTPLKEQIARMREGTNN